MSQQAEITILVFFIIAGFTLLSVVTWAIFHMPIKEEDEDSKQD